MKLSIVSFQFAHNYGAMLQVYALKRYLSFLGNEVTVAPYIPSWAVKEYAYSPFEKRISLKKRVKCLIQYLKRKKQAVLFEKFARDMIGLGAVFSTEEELEKYLTMFDSVIYGSDQIWNTNITGKTDVYFGGNAHNVRKISYAASVGTRELNEVQIMNIKNCLPAFHALSVREQTSKEPIENILRRKIEVVCDPVFLLKKEDWMSIEKSVQVVPDFMVIYLLRYDDILLKHAISYAQKNHLSVYAIHPTLSSFPKDCIPLKQVGPSEFLWLMNHAKCVCTNSFHATAFSIIFRKILLHIPNINSPDRTISLLETMGVPLVSKDVMPLYDFAEVNYSLLNNYITTSKKYLSDALDGD